MKKIVARVTPRHVVLGFILTAIACLAYWYAITNGITIGTAVTLFIAGVVIGFVLGVVNVAWWLHRKFRTEFRAKKGVITRFNRFRTKNRWIFQRSISDDRTEYVAISFTPRRFWPTILVTVFDDDSSDTWWTGTTARTSYVYSVNPVLPISRHVQQSELTLEGDEIRSIGSFSKPLEKKRQALDHLEFNFADATDLRSLTDILDKLHTYKELP